MSLDSNKSLSRLTTHPTEHANDTTIHTQSDLTPKSKQTTHLLLNDIHHQSQMDQHYWYFIPESIFYPTNDTDSDTPSGWVYDPLKSIYLYTHDNHHLNVLTRDVYLECWHYEFKCVYYIHSTDLSVSWIKPPLNNVILMCKSLQDKHPRCQPSKIFTPPPSANSNNPSNVGKISGPVEYRADIAQQMNPMNAPVNNMDNGKMSSNELSSLPSLPQSIKDDISHFHLDGFANQYFTVHKKGIIFKKRIPNQELLWYHPYLKQPLMNIHKSLWKLSLTSFKLINKVIATDDKKDDKSKAVETWSTGACPMTELAALCDMGIHHGALRDEIYVQLVKQCNGNTNSTSLLRAFKCMSVLLNVFPPSKNFESYLLNYLSIMVHSGNSEKQDNGKHESVSSQLSLDTSKQIQEWAKQCTTSNIIQVAKYNYKKLIKICQSGPRGKNPLELEIMKYWDGAFTNALFGESLVDIMQRQQESSDTIPRTINGKQVETKVSDLQVPRILLFLSESLLELGGLKTEGIFRVPGDAESVNQMVYFYLFRKSNAKIMNIRSLIMIQILVRHY
eukprot:NODE_296_length_10502_cov_0.638374.p2 type:complete len:560 gc:universal NODE_296_length_10502_cov_0.638374:1694-15(-)